MEYKKCRVSLFWARRIRIRKGRGKIKNHRQKWKTIFSCKKEGGMLGVQELKRNFEDSVKQVDYSKEYKDNPIYNGIKIENLF